MQVIGNTYVGQAPGGISSEALVQALLQGRGQAQSEYTRQAENQRTDKINLSNSFENEWTKFEDNLLPILAEGGIEAAAERYRAGLELRNQATGGTLTAAYMDQLTGQWIDQAQRRLQFAAHHPSQIEASPDVPPPGGASLGGGAKSVDNVASPAKPGTSRAPEPMHPVNSGDIYGVRVGDTYFTFPDSASASTFAQSRGSTIEPLNEGRNLEANYGVPGIAPSSSYGVASKLNTSKERLVLPGSTTTTTPNRIVQAMSTKGMAYNIMDPQGKILSTYKSQAEAEAALISVKGYANTGYAPARPGGFLAKLGDGGRDELVVDAQTAQTDPLAAVRQALGQGVPPSQPMSLGGGVVPVAAATQGLSPIPPSLQTGAQQPLPMEKNVSAPGQPGLDEAPQGGFEKGQITLVPKSPKVEAVVAKAASTTTGLAAGVAKALEMLNGLDSGKSSTTDRRLQEHVIGDHMHDILRNVSNVTNLPEYKAFLKSIDKKTSDNLANASPEALIAIGMKDVGQAKLQRELTVAQMRQSNANLRLELASRERVAALENEARYGSQMAQTTLTAAEIASKYIDSQASMVAAQEKADKTMAQIYSENPKLWESQQIISKTYGVPLTAVPYLIKKGGWFSKAEYGYRAPTGPELTTYAQLNPAAGVAKSERGSMYMAGSMQTPAQSMGQAPAQNPVTAADFVNASVGSKKSP